MRNLFISIPNAIQQWAQRTPTKPALVDAENNLNYSKVWQYSRLLANFLRFKSVGKGDRVVVMVPSSCLQPLIFTACAMIQSIVLPLDNNYVKNDIKEILLQTKPKLSFICQANTSLVEQIAADIDHLEMDIWTVGTSVEGEMERLMHLPMKEQQDEESKTQYEDTTVPWVVLHSSGTTSGQKKGVMRHQESFITGYLVHLEPMHFTRNEVFLAIYPLFGISSYFFSFMMLYTGATTIIYQHNPLLTANKVFQTILHHQITFTTGGPAHFNALLNASDAEAYFEKLTSLKKILMSGAVASSGLKNKSQTYFRHCSFYEIYGSTEAGIITILSPVDDACKLQSVGVEPLGCKPVLIDGYQGSDSVEPRVGRVLVSTPMMFSEYFQNQQLTASCFEDGWFDTGDLGYKDSQGYLYIVGRSDDRIVRQSGRDIYPAEVEHHLEQVEHVLQSVLLEIEHQLCAVIIVRDDLQFEQEQLSQSLQLHMQKAVDVSKRPQVYHFVRDSLVPRTATAKIKRRQLQLDIETAKAKQ